MMRSSASRQNASTPSLAPSSPRIGVCGINPHAGKNGLVRYGEEERLIEPGVRLAVAQGIDVRGPLPAGALFFRAARGDVGIVVAMCHDYPPKPTTRRFPMPPAYRPAGADGIPGFG